MGQGLAFDGNDRSAARWFASQPGWFEEHHGGAVDAIVGFLAGDGISLEGRDVLDLGCGDGTITLGLANRTTAATVRGLDLQPVDAAWLREVAVAHGVDPSPATLSFGLSSPDRLPCDDASLDVVVTWSVFEHVADPAPLLAEIRRVLRPDGLLFIQVWPLWHSEHGSHLWPFFDRPFQHLVLDDAKLRAQVRERAQPAELAEAMLDLYDSCNRTSLDALGQAVVGAGLYLAKVEVDASSIHVPPALQRTPLSLLTTAGIRMLAVRV